jgi:hypothetical protein
MKFENGPSFDFLGLHFDFSPEQVSVSMPGYARSIIAMLNIKPDDVAEMPYDDSLKKFDPDSPLLLPGQAAIFGTALMMLLYLSTRVRWDLKLAIGVMTTRLRAPTQQDGDKLVLILRNLNGDPERGLVFRKGPMHIESSADASHGDEPDMRGQVGYLIGTGAEHSAPVLVVSRKAASVQPSTAAQEAQALYQCTTDTIWARNHLEELGIAQEVPSPVEQDNQSTIRIMTRGPGWGGASKAFKIRLFWVTEQIDDSLIRLQYVHTSKILADGLTKPFRFVVHYKAWKDMILGKSI